MKRLLEQRSLVRENFVLLIGLCLCVYFLYHAFQGNRSFMRYIRLESSIVHMSQQYMEVRADRETLEAKVKAMRPGSISRDLLEERVRTVLGYRHPDEIELNSN